MPVPSEIFKAYDVRGLYGEQIDEDVAEQVGRGFARVIADLSGKPVSDLRLGLGRDMRLSAPALAARYSAGMQAEGAHVLDAGQVGTEMLYFLVGSRGLDGGLMCTASHNPAAYTGAKLVREGAIALSGDSGIQDIRRMVQEGMPEAPGGGSSEDVDISADFQKGAMAFIDPSNVKRMKVVADGGNGMGGPMVGPLLDQLPLDLVKTYWTPDGHFPDREPNPMLEKNRRFIVDTVLSEGADLGIAWDGDADRCFFIDDINRVGHAFFKTRMRDEGAIFGGEVSGHYYFHDFYNADSGTVPALLILEKLSVEGVKMSELLEPYRSTYFISGEINSEVDDAPAKMALSEKQYADGEITHVDGVSVDYDDWHFNVRASNTEPLLRLTLESLVSPEDMERRRDEVLGLIRS
jgi:phosphomannomutase